MVHKMKLVDFAFKAIKNKEKDIELRLNDEKRRKINKGDIIKFTNIDTNDIIKAEVVDLHNRKDFFELFRDFNYKRFGLDKNDPSIMYNFYPKEDQEKYGALGIEIKLI